MMGEDRFCSDSGAERAARQSLFLGATIETSSGRTEGRIRNLSTTGALLESSSALGMGETISISFRGVDHIRAIVKRSSLAGYGIEFEHAIDPSVCRKSVLKLKGKESDYLLNLREGYRRPIWDNGDVNFRRPPIK